MVFPLTNFSSFQGFGRRLRHYEQLEHLSLNENRELQWMALIRILRHAYDTSPFYRRRFHEAGVRPADLTSPADFKKIPVLTRDDIREHLGEICSSKYRPEELSRAATGGTTSTPVTLMRDPESVREKLAVQWRFNAWAGYLPGEKVFFLWGARSDFPENPTWRRDVYRRYLLRRFVAPTSLFNDEILELYRKALNRFQPRIMYAYPTPLALFCEYLRDRGGSYHRPVSAICTSEPLLNNQRRVIESVLGCPVFNHYGTRDFALVGAECEQHRGLHVNPHAVYMEFSPIEGCEATGLHDVIVTDLLNYGTPMIRYQINDAALLGSENCPCGRGLPVVREITGRTADVFRLPDGSMVPGVALTNRVLQVCQGIKKLQIIQETPADFTLRYVPGPLFVNDGIELLKANLKKFFPPDLCWRFEQVSEIERERSGKTRFCISHVTNVPETAGREVTSEVQGGGRERV